MKRSLLLIVLLLCMVPFVVTAQDATATPVPAEGDLAAPPAEGTVDDGAPTLESVTADPASFYGQEVTFEGVVAELVNTRSFVLGEGVAIDDDQVVVLNNSGQEFNIGLTRDARVLVTGTIYPAFDQGGWDQIMQMMMTDMMPTPSTDMEATEEMMMDDMAMEATEEMPMDMMATDEAMDETMMEATPMATDEMMPMGVTLNDYPTIVLQERFPNFTLLVVDSIESITFVEETEPAQ